VEIAGGKREETLAEENGHAALVKIYNLENIASAPRWDCRFSSGMAAGFIKRQIEGPGRGEGVERGNDGDDDNGERLLTKIEVVVMTGIARDEALRGGTLSHRRSLASFEKKTERERMRERESKRGNAVRACVRTRGEPAGASRGEQGHAKENTRRARGRR